MSETTPAAAPAAAVIAIRYLYQYVNDLDAMRHFYTNLLGMAEGSYRNDEFGSWLTYKAGGFELMFFPAAQPQAVPDQFSAQPGWEGGVREALSWSVLVPELQFAHLVGSLREGQVRCAFAKPQWCQDSYWSFPVLDPMGNTVELYCETAMRPASTEWPAES